MSNYTELTYTGSIDDVKESLVNDLATANKKISELYGFIELIEGLTTDKETAKMIYKFLKRENVW